MGGARLEMDEPHIGSQVLRERIGPRSEHHVPVDGSRAEELDVDRPVELDLPFDLLCVREAQRQPARLRVVLRRHARERTGAREREPAPVHVDEHEAPVLGDPLALEQELLPRQERAPAHVRDRQPAHRRHGRTLLGHAG